MYILKLIAKIALLPLLLVLLTLRILVKISLNLAPILAGGLILVVFAFYLCNRQSKMDRCAYPEMYGNCNFRGYLWCSNDRWTDGYGN